MPTDQLLLFIGAGILLNLTPGPDVLYIVSHALRSGARAGVAAALGITAGCFVHIFAAAVGVSALMAASATAFTVLKWVGAAYLPCPSPPRKRCSARLNTAKSSTTRCCT
jgi:threonine/homoserine/homoserine lactone efflux protein